MNAARQLAYFSNAAHISCWVWDLCIK